MTYQHTAPNYIKDTYRAQIYEYICLYHTYRHAVSAKTLEKSMFFNAPSRSARCSLQLSVCVQSDV